MSSSPLRLVLLIGSLILGVQPSAASNTSEGVKQALADLEMSEAEMSGMHFSKMTIGKSYYATVAWIALETCNGSLVIYMDRHGRATGMDTTGECTMEHVKSR